MMVWDFAKPEIASAYDSSSPLGEDYHGITRNHLGLFPRLSAAL